MVKRESQFTQDRSRYNFVSRKVFDRKCDSYDRKISLLKDRFRELQMLVGKLVSRGLAPSEEE